MEERAKWMSRQTTKEKCKRFSSPKEDNVKQADFTVEERGQKKTVTLCSPPLGKVGKTDSPPLVRGQWWRACPRLSRKDAW